MRHLPEEAAAVAGASGGGGKPGDRPVVARGPAQGRQLLRLGQGHLLGELRLDPRARVHILEAPARQVEGGRLRAALDEQAGLEVGR